MASRNDRTLAVGKINPAEVMKSQGITLDNEDESIDNDSTTEVVASEQKQTKEDSFMKTRTNTLAFAVGDCGGNIVNKAVQDGLDIAAAVYNTSSRGDKYLSDKIKDRIYVKGTDGSGKDPAYAKTLMRESGIRPVIDVVEKYQAKRVVFVYAYDGGTSASAPNAMGKVYNLNDTMQVYGLGVIPRIEEDTKSQYVALKMVESMQKLEGVTKDMDQSISGYLMFDNNHFIGCPLKETHDKVNTEAVLALTLFNEKEFGESDRLCIDSGDFQAILSAGGRITSHLSYTPMKSQEDIHEYIANMVKNSCQPQPHNPKSIGVFVKGPKELIDGMMIDTNRLAASFCKNGHEPAYKPVHMEYNDTFTVGLLTAGNSMPFERVQQIENRYKDFLGYISIRREEEEKKIVVVSAEDPYAVRQQRSKKSGDEALDNL